MTNQTRIIHLDMDSFFASVELVRNPQWRKFPVVIGSAIKNRGIVTTANYVARKYGINSATPMFKAKELCKDLILIPSNMQNYKETSKTIGKILQSFCANVDFVSIDEAYLDISYLDLSDQQAIKMLSEIRATIFAKTGLASSAGLASNRILAKIASEKNKPNGEFYILSDQEQDFIDALELRKISGIGKKTAKKLEDLNIKTCADLKESELLKNTDTDKFLTKIIEFAKGESVDFSKKIVQNKSISYERTFLQNIDSLQECQKILHKMFIELNVRARKSGEIETSGIFIKLKFANFSQITREKTTTERNLTDFAEILTEAWTHSPIRLLGLGYKLT